MKHNFKNLKIWQMGMDLVIDIYRETKQFPPEEKFGLVSQINRSVTSVPSNIAEGSGKGTNKEFANFLRYSLGSLYELETQIIASNRLNYINNSKFEILEAKINELERMKIGFINSLDKTTKV